MSTVLSLEAARALFVERRASTRAQVERIAAELGFVAHHSSTESWYFSPPDPANYSPKGSRHTFVYYRPDWDKSVTIVK